MILVEQRAEADIFPELRTMKCIRGAVTCI